MNEYNDGKIWGWNGGDCPVHPQSKVVYWLRNDSQRDATGEAGHLDWRHALRDWDVIAFRVVKQHVEPKTIWVNEHENGFYAYRTEEAAKRNAGSRATRVAVEYREVRK